MALGVKICTSTVHVYSIAELAYDTGEFFAHARTYTILKQYSKILNHQSWARDNLLASRQRQRHNATT